MKRAASLLVAAVWMCAALPCAAQTVTRGPYLQIGTTTSVVVRWRTDVATDSRVNYGTAVGQLNDTADDAASTTEHEVTVTGLSTGATYYYSIGTSSAELAGGSADYRFHASPPVGSTGPVRVWVIGDSGQPGADADAVAQAYIDHPGSDDTDVWLMLGDNAYNTGTDEQYQAAVFDTYPTLLRRIVLWPTRGNHDQLQIGDNNDYYEIFSLPTAAQAGGLASGAEQYYSFDYGNVHFICLDSQGSNRNPGGGMMLWLGQDLAATSQDWIIAYWHHPPYTKGSHDSDVESQLIEMRENALPILEAGGVDLVLTGHSHSYERSFLLDGHYGTSGTLTPAMKIDDGDGRPGGDGAYTKPTLGPGAHEGAVYAVAGSSSKISGGTLNHPVMVTSLNELGSLVLDINGNLLEAEFIDDTGVVRDSFTMVKGVTPVPVGPTPAPSIARLSPARPNPFDARTDIDYFVPSSGRVEVVVYDVRGRRVRTLVDREREAGDHTASWDGRDANGAAVPAGVYFAVLRAGGERRVQRLTVLR